MQLPKALRTAIENEFEGFRLKDILKAREDLSERYLKHQPKNHSFITSPAERCAYIATRLPATYVAITRVLQEVLALQPEAQVKSLLDLGAGPGTAIWAASNIFPGMEQITLIEKDRELALIGKRLASHTGYEKAVWKEGDLEKLDKLPEHDLILLSYSIGELSPQAVKPLLENCWQAAKQFLVIIEPGTPAGFERIRAIRSHLISLGAPIIAPCPHNLACPMAGGNWCHFTERVERTSIHRRIKGGTLGYEDEKFSYVAFSKVQAELPQARVLRHPQIDPRRIGLTLCTKEGLKQKTVTKRTPDLFKIARKLDWGSTFP